MPRRPPRVTVTITCKPLGECCVRRGKQKICGRNIPWDYFDVNGDQLHSMRRGGRLSRKLDKAIWDDLVDLNRYDGFAGARQTYRKSTRGFADGVYDDDDDDTDEITQVILPVDQENMPRARHRRTTPVKDRAGYVPARRRRRRSRSDTVVLDIVDADDEE